MWIFGEKWWATLESNQSTRATQVKITYYQLFTVGARGRISQLVSKIQRFVSNGWQNISRVADTVSPSS